MSSGLSRLEQDSQLNIRKRKENICEPDFFSIYNTRDTDRDGDDNNTNADDIESDRRHMTRNKGSNSKFGEITGKAMKIDDIDYGMPVRSNYTGKRLTKKEDTLIKGRDRFDFNLYDEDANSSDKNNYNINNFEPNGSSSFSNFTDIQHGTEKVIPEVYGSDPGSFMSANLNKYCIQLHNLVQTQVGVNRKFCISSYSLYAIFGSLYNVSHSKSENELYDYFNMIAKENVHEGLSYIEQIKNKLSGQLIMKHLIFIDNTHEVDDEMVKHLSSISNIHQVALDTNTHINTEFKTINDYIKKISGNSILPISRKVLEAADLLCVSIAYIKPIWKIPFDKIVDGKFSLLNNDQKLVKMMLKYDGTYDYYEDSDNQVIELKCIDDKLSMGIILPKDFTEPIIKHSELIVSIKELKPVAIDEFCMPCFTDQIKIRLSNMLYQSGLKGVFGDMKIPELVKDNIKVTDVVQNITVCVTGSNLMDKDKKIPKRMRSGISNVRFIANKPFIYYFRLVSTNTIMIMGYFT